MKLKFKVGDKVRVKSLEWYNENKQKDGTIDFDGTIFTPKMSECCGKEYKIIDIDEDGDYTLSIDDCWYFSDDMLEDSVIK